MAHDEPSLDLVWGLLTGFQQTAALKAGVDLDVFTAVGEGTDTVPALAKRCAASERGMRILCDHFAVIGLLTRSGDRYGLAPTAAAFLDRKSPAFVGSATTFIASPYVTQGFEHLTEAVRRGGTAHPTAGSLEPEHPMWIEFARAMAPLASMTGTLLANMLDVEHAGALKVLDIAAGHGMFGIAVARANPKAEVTGLDWANVLAVARENATAAGVAARYHTIPGSAFEVDWGSGYDLVLLTNFLHHFDVATCVTLLERSRASLAPGGRVLAVDMVPNPDRVSPPLPAMFAFMMLASTPRGDSYTAQEYVDMGRAAGFARASVAALPPTPQSVIAFE
jgi:2-polyprenyl-3-methyl-5-hydroxy-6-metoxy-1,4-benzoquinol methylase